MYISFDKMPKTAKIWVYTSNKLLEPQIQQHIEQRLIAFCEKWTKHGEPLLSSFTVKHQQFIILAVDENYCELSGCAINKSIKIMKELEEDYNIELMNRLNTAFVFENKIKVLPLKIFKDYITQKMIQPETVVFNNLVTTLSEFETQWQVPAYQSWHNRFLN